MARRSLGRGAQVGELFDGSIAENLLAQPRQASLEQVRSVLEACGLADDVWALPDGLVRKIGEVLDDVRVDLFVLTLVEERAELSVRRRRRAARDLEHGKREGAEQQHDDHRGGDHLARTLRLEVVEVVDIDAGGLASARRAA